MLLLLTLIQDIMVRFSVPSKVVHGHMKMQKFKEKSCHNLDNRKFNIVHTITKALDAAVKFIPTPPAFSDISNT
jgi:hypothetical protein